MMKDFIKRIMSIDTQGVPFVTLTQPVHFETDSFETDRIEFKNLASSIREELLQTMDIKDIEFYDAALKLFDTDDLLWSTRKENADGLSYIVSPIENFYYTYSHDVPSFGIVDERPYLLPMFEEEQFSRHFYVLALHVDSFQLYEVRNNRLSIVKLPEGSPDTFEQAVGVLTEQKHESIKGSGDHVGYHSSGSAKDGKLAERRSFFEAVDDYLTHADFLNRKIPIILFALPENQGNYLKLTKNHQIDRNALIPKSPESYDLKFIEQEVTDSLVTREQELVDALYTRYDGFVGEQKIERETDAIRRLASEGSVDTLIINKNKLSHPDALLNEIAIDVVSQSGQVFIVEDERFGAGRAVALMRRPHIKPKKLL